MVDQPNLSKTSTFYVVLILLVSLGYYLVAFYPYEIALPEYATNGARWLPDGSLSFELPGIALEKGGQRLLEKLASGKTVQILVDVYSFAPSQIGPARIVSFSRNPYSRNLTIAQSNTDLVVRIRRLNSDLNGMPDLVIPGVFADRGWRRIEIRILQNSVEISVDGVARLTAPNDPLSFSQWDWSYPWVFGNERTGDRPWQGEIRMAEVCADQTCVDVIHPDILSVPDRFWIGDWRTLVDMKQLVSRAPIDIVINLLGFVPFGFFVARVRRPVVTLGMAVLFAAMLSFSIEMGQILFQHRYTSLVDLFCNVTGALAGYSISRRLIGASSAG